MTSDDMGFEGCALFWNKLFSDSSIHNSIAFFRQLLLFRLPPFDLHFSFEPTFHPHREKSKKSVVDETESGALQIHGRMFASLVHHQLVHFIFAIPINIVTLITSFFILFISLSLIHVYILTIRLCFPFRGFVCPLSLI